MGPVVNAVALDRCPELIGLGDSGVDGEELGHVQRAPAADAEHGVDGVLIDQPKSHQHIVGVGVGCEVIEDGHVGHSPQSGQHA